MFQFNVNTDAVIAFTNKLEKLPRAAFPVAVRGTLNAMAFYVKKTSMPFEAGRAFQKRDKNFFKFASRVDQARGFHLASMKASVGFRPLGGTNTAVEDLEEQERGGKIANRSFVPMDKARVSGSKNRIVQKKNRISGIKNIVKVADARGSNDKQKFLKSVIFAGEGGFVLTEKNLFRVDTVKRIRGSYRFKLTGLYSFKKNRTINVKATHFMDKASRTASKHANQFYELEAKRQFDKYFRQ